MERRVRLRRASDIKAIYEEGKTWKHPLLVLMARPNRRPVTRIGVTASKRLGSAVVRNRAKRLLREAARRLYNKFGSGWDVMLIARTRMVDARAEEVERALAALLRRAQLAQRQRENNSA